MGGEEKPELKNECIYLIQAVVILPNNYREIANLYLSLSVPFSPGLSQQKRKNSKSKNGEKFIRSDSIKIIQSFYSLYIRRVRF